MAEVVLFSDTHSAHVRSDELETFYRNSGVYRIATEIRNYGFTCQVVDLFFTFNKEELQEICDKFITKETLIVGFSTNFWYKVDRHNKGLIAAVLLVITYAKKINPNVQILFGGHSAGELKELFPIGTAIQGYAEDELLKFLSSVRPSKNENLFDFNSSKITYLDHDFINKGEIPIIEISRGCIFRCKFCNFPMNGKKRFDYIKDPEILRDELIFNYEKYGITYYTFSDDTFNDSTYKLELLHKIFSSLPFKLRFVSYIRIEGLWTHPEQLQLLKELGIIGAFFGIETFNKESGKVIGKAYNENKVKEFLYQLKTEHWGEDVNLSVSLISGLPRETEESHKQTIDWILDQKYCLVDRVKSGPLTVNNPLKNKDIYESEFAKDSSKYGFYWPDPNSNEWKNINNYYAKSRSDAVRMSNEVVNASSLVNKTRKGAFNLMSLANLSLFSDNPVTPIQLQRMSGYEYDQFYINNIKKFIKSYITNYKNNILNL